MYQRLALTRGEEGEDEDKEQQSRRRECVNERMVKPDVQQVCEHL